MSGITNPLLNTPLPSDGQENWGPLINQAIINLRTFASSLGNNPGGNNPGGHTHTIAEIIGLMAELNGKLDMDHFEMLFVRISALEEVTSVINPLLNGVTFGINVSTTQTHIFASLTMSPWNVWVSEIEYRFQRPGHGMHFVIVSPPGSANVPVNAIPGVQVGTSATINVTCIVRTPKAQQQTSPVAHHYTPLPIGEPNDPGGGGHNEQLAIIISHLDAVAKQVNDMSTQMSVMGTTINNLISRVDEIDDRTRT